MRITGKSTASVLGALALLAGVVGFAVAQSGDAGGSANTSDPGGAVAFAPGVSYEDAIVALHISQSSGTQPLAMEPAEPLPEGVVALLPDSADGRVVIDTARPFGYDVALRARVGATYTGPEPTADTPKSRFGPWYQGWRLAVPELPACMVISERGQERPSCTQADKVAIAGYAELP